MNGVEEIYVLCNRVRWHDAYLPEVYGNNVGIGTYGQDGQRVQGTTSDDTDDEDYRGHISNFQLFSWQTKATLTQLDDQIAAFDNQALDLGYESYFKRDSLEKSDVETLTGDDSILNLDDTSFDEDSLYLQHVSVQNRMNIELGYKFGWRSVADDCISMKQTVQLYE